ncbi:hypothetical protein CL634_03490 [bacterium]|nr:hypothetical protein [bacterium]|tara:strand:+ start:123 stop:464 length:342 start_codon:yes stop_codon:yes gene_type:complete
MADTWTIEELKDLTSTVSSETIEYRGKDVTIQWCELTEAEEPKTELPDDSMTDDEKQEVYQTIGNTKVRAMMAKADGMNPEEALGLHDAWEDLPTTLRYQISAKVLGANTPDF